MNDKQARWLALYVLCLGDLMIVLDTNIVNVALPSIQADLGFSHTTLAWVVNAYMLTFGGFLLLSGRLGDLFGNKKVFLLGVVSFTAARSNTASRTGMTTSVAHEIASVTAGDMFGGVSTNAHSMPSAVARSTISFTPPREPSRNCGSAVPRSLCHSEVDPCGSQSISMQRRDGRLA
jgi:MFS family permease